MTEIDIVLTRIEHKYLLQNVRTIPGEFYHVLALADIDE